MRKICLKIRTFRLHTFLFFRISRGQTPLSRGCCLYKKERRKKDTLRMGSGGDVFYTSLPIHELLVPFSKANQNSSLSNSAFCFTDHTEKRNTNSLLNFVFGYCLSFYFDPFYFKMKMYLQFLEDICRYSQTIWCKIVEMRKIKRRVLI